MSTAGPKRTDGHERRSMKITFPPKIWRELERLASENYRAVNAEIAVRVIESLPTDNDRH